MSRTKRPGPAGGKRDVKRRENIQCLGDSALALFLEAGTEGVSVDQIVERAGMAKGSFYRYARDKADLVEQIMAPVGEEVTAALDACARALVTARRETLAAIYVQLANDLAKVVARWSPRVQLYLQEMRSPPSATRASIHAIAAQLTSRAIELTETARAHGLIRAVDAEVSALTVLGAVDALLFQHLRGRRISPKAIPELVAIVLGGIMRDA